MKIILEIEVETAEEVVKVRRFLENQLHSSASPLYVRPFAYRFVEEIRRGSLPLFKREYLLQLLGKANPFRRAKDGGDA